MELQQLNHFLTPSHLLWLGAGLQMTASLACWFIAEAAAGSVSAMQVSPWPVLRERATPQDQAAFAPILRLREQVSRHDAFAASAMIERDAA